MKVIHTQKEILQSPIFWPSLGTNHSIFGSALQVMPGDFSKRSVYPFKGFAFLNPNEKRPTSFLPLYVLPLPDHRNPQTLCSLTLYATWVKWFNLFKGQFPSLYNERVELKWCLSKVLYTLQVPWFLLTQFRIFIVFSCIYLATWTATA